MIFNLFESDQHHYSSSRLGSSSSMPNWGLQNLSPFLQLPSPPLYQKPSVSNPQTPFKSKQKEITLYKTEFCRNWIELGHCRYGTKCLYAHGEKEIRTVPRHARYKTQICRAYHSDGSCPYGIRCTFIHDSDYTSERRDMNSPVSNASTNFGSTTSNSTSPAASIHEADSIWSPSPSFMTKNSKTTFPVVAMRNF
ncbi:hypothetical protein RMATCC62417_02501 [Rhizopus microsporus]|nr:hypothetical protein RMATCC62417_02501 [Rhizopus microsporus]